MFLILCQLSSKLGKGFLLFYVKKVISSEFHLTFRLPPDIFQSFLENRGAMHISSLLQGNSNSLATVDVASGYVGLTDFSPLWTGLLLTLNTFGGHIFWLARLFERSSDYNGGREVSTAAAATAVVISWPMTVYFSVCVALRHHLFVWTVFSPKLLYAGLLNITICSLVALALWTNVFQARCRILTRKWELNIAMKIGRTYLLFIFFLKLFFIVIVIEFLIYSKCVWMHNVLQLEFLP